MAKRYAISWVKGNPSKCADKYSIEVPKECGGCHIVKETFRHKKAVTQMCSVWHDVPKEKGSS